VTKYLVALPDAFQRPGDRTLAKNRRRCDRAPFRLSRLMLELQADRACRRREGERAWTRSCGPPTSRRDGGDCDGLLRGFLSFTPKLEGILEDPRWGSAGAMYSR
jgi:hypothetical protein